MQLWDVIDSNERFEFRCPFRVGREVLLAARLGQRPQVGRAALLSAGVTAYKPHHYRGPDESPAFLFCRKITHCLNIQNRLNIHV